jgi:hypothetical protein
MVVGNLAANLPHRIALDFRSWYLRDLAIVSQENLTAKRNP